jgi:Domain of unknown function (DUF4396)
MDNAHGHGHEPESLNRAAFGATWHCLTGCAIGEILGLVIATALNWGNVASIAIAIVLAFIFGYSLTLRPLVRSGVPLRRAISLGGVSEGGSEVAARGAETRRGRSRAVRAEQGPEQGSRRFRARRVSALGAT